MPNSPTSSPNAAAELYQYLNFDKITGFEDEGRIISEEDVRKLAEV
jgi:aconitate hydratase 2 / 2-methylisocitrate dehydratase